jgi:anti-sigma factor RsiW
MLHLGGYGCGDTERLLFEFVEEELPAEVRAKLEKHLADCRSCMECVATYRQTIEATHDHALPKIEMPAELHRRLQEFIAQNPDLQ